VVSGGVVIELVEIGVALMLVGDVKEGDDDGCD